MDYESPLIYQGAPADPSSKVVDALWRDAQAQAKAEQSAWPYSWFRNPDYVQESGRGSVSGTLRVLDPGKRSAQAGGAWIGLAPDDEGTEFQEQARTYQFWVKTGADGQFTIPHVLPGSYHASEKRAPEADLSRRIWALRMDALRRALA